MLEHKCCMCGDSILLGRHVSVLQALSPNACDREKVGDKIEVGDKIDSLPVSPRELDSSLAALTTATSEEVEAHLEA